MKKQKDKGISSTSDKSSAGTVDVKKQDRSAFPFGRDNYTWLLIGLVFLLVGFLLMIGGGSKDPDVFNYGMFNFQRLTLAPVLLFIGYLIGIYAILKKPTNSQD